jgi:hypothetical protein
MTAEEAAAYRLVTPPLAYLGRPLGRLGERELAGVAKAHGIKAARVVMGPGGPAELMRLIAASEADRAARIVPAQV